MQPMLESHPVVFAQALDVARLETSRFRATDRASDRRQEMTQKKGNGP